MTKDIVLLILIAGAIITGTLATIGTISWIMQGCPMDEEARARARK